MDGYCRVSAHGGLGISYDVIKITDEDEKLSFDVRYYSDSAEFGDGGVIRYSFERTNSDYGLRLLGIEKTVDTGLPIFYFAV
jgi:hypothetical protein